MHFWISFEGRDGVEGFADFSLHGETGAPSVFGQKCFPNDWHFDVASDSNDLAEKLNKPKRQCVYCPIETHPITIQQLHCWMNQPFEAAKQRGFNFRLGKIMAHCSEVLTGQTESLRSKTQFEAWNALVARP